MKNTKFIRAIAFIFDYVIWYLLLAIVGFILYMVNQNTATVDPEIYASTTNALYKQLPALTIYLIILIIYEVIVPLFTGGISLSKRIFKLRLESISANQVVINNKGLSSPYLERPSSKQIIVRGLLKILIVNPWLMISYFFMLPFGPETFGWIIDIFIIALIVDIVFILCSKPALHDRLTHTNIIRVSIPDANKVSHIQNSK